MSIIETLQDWYAAFCDSDWEHSYGITIETLDNPGWSVDIDLTDTPLEFYPFEIISIARDEINWIRCMKEDKKFKGRGGARNLKEILEIFIDWASRSPDADIQKDFK